MGFSAELSCYITFFLNDHITLRMLRSKHKASLLYQETFIVIAIKILIHMHASNTNSSGEFVLLVNKSYYTHVICMKGIGSIFFHGSTKRKP